MTAVEDCIETQCNYINTNLDFRHYSLKARTVSFIFRKAVFQGNRSVQVEMVLSPHGQPPACKWKEGHKLCSWGISQQSLSAFEKQFKE